MTAVRICPHGLHLKPGEWCGECVKPNLMSDIIPFDDVSALVIKSLPAESKIKEFRIHEEMMLLEHHRFSHDYMIGVMREMLKRRMIKSFTIYDDPATMDRVIRIEKL